MRCTRWSTDAISENLNIWCVSGKNPRPVTPFTDLWFIYDARSTPCEPDLINTYHFYQHIICLPMWRLLIKCRSQKRSFTTVSPGAACVSEIGPHWFSLYDQPLQAILTGNHIGNACSQLLLFYLFVSCVSGDECKEPEDCDCRWQGQMFPPGTVVTQDCMEWWTTATCISWYVNTVFALHDDVIKGKHSLRYWSFVRGIHRSPVNSPNKGQWRGALVFSLISPE